MQTDARGFTALFRQADAAYKDCAAELETLKRTRDQVVLNAHRSGMSFAQMADAIGVSRPWIQQMVERARKAEAEQ